MFKQHLHPYSLNEKFNNVNFYSHMLIDFSDIQEGLWI